MIVLHATRFGSDLVLWGEAPQGSSAGQRVRPLRVVERGFARYPFSVDNTALTDVMSESVPMFRPHKKRRQKFVAWLPTVEGAPIPSSPLVGDGPDTSAPVTLSPWWVPGYRLRHEEAVQLLCACDSRRTLAAGVVIAPDVSFWADLLRFAGSLVARERFLPGIRPGRAEDMSYGEALWEPVLMDNDAQRLASLSARMPGVARAFSDEAATEPPSSAPAIQTKEFVDAAVDYLVRLQYLERSIPDRPATRKPKKFNSLHEGWVHALTSEARFIVMDETAAEKFATQISRWRRPIELAASSRYRFCFRLEEPALPAEDEPVRKQSAEGWFVRFLLQPREDLSLHIPLQEVWNLKGSQTEVLKDNGSALREYVLSSLGQAASICPRIAASLRTSEPAGYELDPAGAYEFLTEKALTLEQAGFTVMLPAWWTKKGATARVAMTAKVKSPKMQTAGSLSLGEIVKFDWELAVGEEKLTFPELEALAKMKAPLVRLRGQWVEVNAQEMKSAVDFWKKASAKQTVRDVIQMAIGAKTPPRGFEFSGVKATGWIGDLLGRLESGTRLEEIAPMQSFSGILRPYQVRGYSWLAFLSQWGLGACLADDMGLGKTIQTLALIQRRWNTNAQRPTLLVCPTTVVTNWRKEAARFTPDLPVMVHHGIGRRKESSFTKEAKKHAIVVSSYGLLHRDLEFLQKVDWDGVVLDEAQNIKNPETKQAKSARSLDANYRIALTGTPVENNVGDLWSIMEFLNPGFLGTQTEFKRTFFVPIQAEGDTRAAERLKRITGPFLLRRLKTDRSIISDLPEKMEMKEFCSLTREQASLYAAVVKETERALASADGIGRKGLILATLSKLKQVCNHPAQFLGDNSAIADRSGKLTRLTEMLEEILEVGDRALIFSQFAEMGKILQGYLRDTFSTETLFLYGGTPKAQRDRMVDRFQGDKGPRIFVLSLKAGGTGLNLTAANHVFHFDRWWNPAVETQATDRAFRIGQTRNVQVRKFVCAGTLEEKIDAMIESKRDVAEKVVGTGEGWLTELSDKQLKALWALSKDAVGE